MMITLIKIIMMILVIVVMVITNDNFCDYSSRRYSDGV